MISYKDIADLFGELEVYLIRSLKRNLQRHKEWEADEGFDWTAWQAEKIRNLNRYRRQNKKIAKYFLSKILPDTKQLLQEQYDEYSETDPSFFKMNNRRMDALIKEMTSIEETVTRAAVRNMDDVYRQTISKAALALNSGTMTLNQAVDLATKDFLQKGITCVQYKNGRRVNIASYAEMALRTNATRAQLLGMGAKMMQLGVDTVLVSQYGGCSPTCLPWQGKVYINDVFMDFEGKKGVSWGVSCNGKEYMLLSYAVQNGLFHPNCRHHMGIYNEGITRIPPPLDEETVNRNYALEQQQRALEREIRLYKRLEAGVLDEEKKKMFTDKRKLAQNKLKIFTKENSDVLRRDLWRERLVPDTSDISDDSIVKDTAPKDYPVTTHSVRYMKSYFSKVLDIKGINKLKAVHQQLLQKVMNEPLGTEYARAFDLDINPLGDYIKGAAGQNSVQIPRYNVPYIAVHNHPSDEMLSEKDIHRFISDDNMIILTAVGNRGSVYAVEKDKNYDKINAKNAYILWDAQQASRYNSISEYKISMDALFKELKKYGINAFTAKN